MQEPEEKKIDAVLTLQVSIIIFIILGCVAVWVAKTSQQFDDPMYTRNQLCMAYDNYQVSAKNRTIPDLEKLCAIQ